MKTMKILPVVLLLTLSCNLSAQSKVTGHYYNHFFCELKINADSTFDYDFYSHFIGRWTKGTWTLDGDTVYFHIVPMYDTLSITKVNGMKADTFILSTYSIPRRITPKDTGMVTMTWIEQSRNTLPERLVFTDNKLYEIKDGKLVTEKRRVIKRGSEADPWYFKSHAHNLRTTSIGKIQARKILF